MERGNCCLPARLYRQTHIRWQVNKQPNTANSQAMLPARTLALRSQLSQGFCSWHGTTACFVLKPLDCYVKMPWCAALSIHDVKKTVLFMAQNHNKYQRWDAKSWAGHRTAAVLDSVHLDWQNMKYSVRCHNLIKYIRINSFSFSTQMHFSLKVMHRLRYITTWADFT